MNENLDPNPDRLSNTDRDIERALRPQAFEEILRVRLKY